MKTIRIFISSPGDVAVERDKARKVARQLVAGFVVLCILSALPAWLLVPRIYNNWLLARFENSVGKLPLNIVATEAQVGALWGCGNHCDMQIIALVNCDTPNDTFARELAPLLARVRYPFSSGGGGPDLYEKDGSQWIHIGLITAKGVSTMGDSRYLESHETTLMDSLLARHPGSGNRILLFSDQTYSGFSMKDWRCF